MIHSSAVTRNTHNTRFCATSQGSLSGKLADSALFKPRDNHHMATGSNSTTTGSPQRIQPRKLTSSPVSSV